MEQIQRYYPHQGSRRFQTTSGVVIKSFRIDAGELGSNSTGTSVTFRKGDMILGFQVVVTEAMDSADDGASLAFGFTSTEMLSAATAQASLDAVGDVVGCALGDNTSGGPLTLSAADTFDVTSSGSKALSAGKFDVHVTYVPAPDGVCDSTYKEWVTV